MTNEYRPNPGTGPKSGGSPADNVATTQEQQIVAYLADCKSRITKQWEPPKGHGQLKIVTAFKILADGLITELRIISSTGPGAADNTAIQAIKESLPLPAIPPGLPRFLDIQFAFERGVMVKEGVEVTKTQSLGPPKRKSSP